MNKVFWLLAILILFCDAATITVSYSRPTYGTRIPFFEFFTTPGDQVTKDTVIGGWNVKLTYYKNRTDSSECIVFFPGAGEVGTDISLLLKYGPHYWLTQGWDGGVPLGNGVHYPILASIQYPSQSVITPVNLKARLDPLFTRFKIKRNAFYLTGPSAGGFASWAYATYQATPGVFTGYGDRVTAILGPEAVKPNQQQGSTPVYPGNTVAWMNLGGKSAWAMNQINDPSRDIPNYYAAMNAAQPGQVTYINTNFHGGGHGDFQEAWNPYRNDWLPADNPDTLLAVPIGAGIPKGSNTLQWLLRRGDTSIAGVVGPSVNAGRDTTVPTVASSISFTAVGSPGTSGAIVSYAWSQTSGGTLPLSGTSTATLTATGPFTVGARNFHVVATDAGGFQAADDVSLTVLDTTTKVTIFAGRDTTIGLDQEDAWGNHLRDTTRLQLKGSGTGSIVSWLWRQLTGISVVLKSPSSPICMTEGYQEGRASFELAGTTSSGVTVRDTINVRSVNWQIFNAQDLRPGGGIGWHLTRTGTGLFIYQHLDQIARDVNGDGTIDHIQGGDTVYIPGGTYFGIALSGWHGKPGSILTIVPEDSAVISSTLTGTNYFRAGTGVDDSSSLTFCKFDGTVFRNKGGPYYGFQNDDPNYIAGAVGLTCNATSDTKFYGFAIHNVGVGVFCKNNSDSGHVLQTFDKFRFKNMGFYDFYIRHTGAEAMYLGHTQPDGKGLQGGQNNGPTVRGDSIEVAYVIIDSASFDGIQVSNFRYQNIHHNISMNTGYLNTSSQRANSIMGGNVTGLDYFNVGYNCKEGKIGTPYGRNVQIHDNYLDSVKTGAGSGPLAADAFSWSGAGPTTTAQEINDSAAFQIYNNILNRVEDQAIRVYNPNNFNAKVGTVIYNNIIADPSKTLAQLISTEFVPSASITGNQLITGTLPVTIVDLSNKTTGPKIRVTYGSTTQDFTDGGSIVSFIRSQITGVSPCNCVTSPIEVLKQP